MARLVERHHKCWSWKNVFKLLVQFCEVLRSNSCLPNLSVGARGTLSPFFLLESSKSPMRHGREGGDTRGIESFVLVEARLSVMHWLVVNYVFGYCLFVRCSSLLARNIQQRPTLAAATTCWCVLAFLAVSNKRFVLPGEDLPDRVP
jgi:hypothetical protein